MDKELLDYFGGDELAANVWKSKYATEGESTPSDMHMRMAVQFAITEYIYVLESRDYIDNEQIEALSDYGQDSLLLNEEELPKGELLNFLVEKYFALFDKFKYIIPQGSIMYGLGRGTPVSLSNCFVIAGPEDSYGGIYLIDEEQAQLMKRRGGVGHDLSNLRPKGTKVLNSAKHSTGAVSFAHRYSNTTREVAQDGRRGALMLSIDINHPDSLDFIKSKRDRTSLTGANISVRLNNDFMNAVENDEDYILRFPCDKEFSEDVDFTICKYNKLIPIDSGYIKRIKAKEYWNEIVHSAKGYAEPGLLYWDRILNYAPDGVYDRFKAVGTNPCVTGDTTVLTDKGYFPIIDLVGEKVNVWNGEEFSEVSPTITGENQKILIINLSDGREIKCTPYHRFITNEGEDVKAIDLKINTKLAKYDFPIINKGTTVPTKIAYSQGFYSGDGNKGLNTIWLYEEKINLADKLSGKIIGNEYVNITGTKRVCFKLDFKVNPVDFVPTNEYSLQSKLDWLSGLIDSDGYLTKDSNLQIVSTDYEFLIGVQNLLSTLGCNSKITLERKESFRKMPDGKGENKKYLCKDTYRILVGAMQVKQLIELGLMTHRIYLDGVNPNRDATRFITITSIKEQQELEEFVYCFNEPKKHQGVFNGILTGQCGEIPMGSYDSCRLIALNLFSFVDKPFTNKATINYDKLYEISYEQQKIADNIIDLEVIHIDKILEKIKNDDESYIIKEREIDLWTKIKKITLEGRRTGGGFTAFGDILAAINVRYGSDESLEVIDKIGKTMMQGALDCSIDLAILRGHFPAWDRDLEFTNNLMDGRKGKNDFFNMLLKEFPEQVKKMWKYGRRNISWSTIAPTGTVSLMTQTTSGIEPLFMPFYKRRKKINPNDKGVKIDFVDENGDSWQEFIVLHEKFKMWMILNDNITGYSDALKDNQVDFEYLEDCFTSSPWYGSTANDIPWKERNKVQSTFQKWITHAISSTINLPKTTSEQEVSNIYLDGWKRGLKGQTVYVDGSRSGVLISDSSKKEDEIEYNTAPKRPKTLNCDVHVSTTKGVKLNIVVGLLKGKPYEVFILDHFMSDSKMQVKRIKSGRYDLIKNGETYSEDITSEMNEFYEMTSRNISASLRHGVDIRFIVDQLNSVKNQVMTSFSRSLARVLSKYIIDGVNSTLKCTECGSKDMIYEEGCNKCLNCGHSACS